ncbi:MAG: RidA family protein [Oligoflexus sp.]
MKQSIHTDLAPKALGPYSQAIKSGSTIYCSGQIPLDPKTGNLVSGDIATETRQVMENLKAVLQEAGASFKDVVKTTIYLQDLKNFSTVNEIYASYLEAPYPARATFEVAGLPLGASVEIEMIAHCDS